MTCISICTHLPACSLGITVLSCTDISGSASVTHVRGKARFMYEYTYNMNFEIVPPNATSASAKTFKGKIKVLETNNDQDPADYDLMLEWGGKSPSGPDMGACRKGLLGGEMRACVRKNMQAFEEKFQEL